MYTHYIIYTIHVIIYLVVIIIALLFIQNKLFAVFDWLWSPASFKASPSFILIGPYLAPCSIFPWLCRCLKSPDQDSCHRQVNLHEVNDLLCHEYIFIAQGTVDRALLGVSKVMGSNPLKPFQILLSHIPANSHTLHAKEINPMHQGQFLTPDSQIKETIY